MKLHFSKTLSILWTLLLMTKLVSCQQLDSNEIEQELQEPEVGPSGPTKVIITTGWDTTSKNVEIFDMATGTLLNCPKIQPFPISRLDGASGGIIEGTPMVCGGYGKINGQRNYSTTCHSLNQHGHWIEDQTAMVNPGRARSGSIGNVQLL